ncbi:MAG: autotransporter adhesin family protein [Candidatus Omnitrophica bacterium]|nr:autotransporter adhesin family protein [Candidatus Omnitrophota bacterium]
MVCAIIACVASSPAWGDDEHCVHHFYAYEDPYYDNPNNWDYGIPYDDYHDMAVFSASVIIRDWAYPWEFYADNGTTITIADNYGLGAFSSYGWGSCTAYNLVLNKNSQVYCSSQGLDIFGELRLQGSGASITIASPSVNLYGGLVIDTTGSYTIPFSSSLELSSLSVGDGAGYTGQFNYDGTISITTGGLTIGNSGTGTISQSAGILTVSGDLAMGVNEGSSGTYDYNGGTLYVGRNVTSGSGTSTFNVNTTTPYITIAGGSISGTTLNVGNINDGELAIGPGITISGDTENIGLGAYGRFIQYGGSNTINKLNIGMAENYEGIYTLQGGVLTVNDSIGNGPGTGTLNIDGGTMSGTWTTMDVDNLNIGWGESSEGVSFTQNSGQTITAGNMSIGNGITVSSFTQQDDVTIENTLGIASGSTYTLYAGALSTGSISGSGTFAITGNSASVNAATIDVGTFNIGSGVYFDQKTDQSINATYLYIEGAFTQNDTVTVEGDMTLNAGYYDLQSGDLTVSGQNGIVGSSGSNFYYNGGSISVPNGRISDMANFTIGDNLTLEVPCDISTGNMAIGIGSEVIQSGHSVSIGGGINPFGDNQGTYTYNGGSLSLGHTMKVDTLNVNSPLTLYNGVSANTITIGSGVELAISGSWLAAGTINTSSTRQGTLNDTSGIALTFDNAYLDTLTLSYGSCSFTVPGNIAANYINVNRDVIQNNYSVSLPNGVMNLNSNYDLNGGVLSISDGSISGGSISINGGLLLSGSGSNIDLATLYIGDSAVGSFRVYGSLTANTINIGSGGTGTFVQSADAQVGTEDNPIVTMIIGAGGTYRILGGTLYANTLDGSNGTIDIRGTDYALNTQSDLEFASLKIGTSTETASYTLEDQKILTVGEMVIGDNGTFDMNGGILHATDISGTGDFIMDGGTFDLAGTFSGPSFTMMGGMLKGVGELDTAVTIPAGGILSPGDSPGTQTFTNLTFDENSIYLWEINSDIIGGKGADPGWDWINVTGMLSVNPGAILEISYLDNFLPQIGSSFIVISAGSIPTWNDFTLQFSGGQPATGWSMSKSGTDVFLNYGTGGEIPEPATVVGIMGAFIIVGWRRIRRTRMLK